MKIFTLADNYSVVCNSQSTRSGFRHVASVCRNGESIGSTKICYLNRTWECYQFESVLMQAIDKFFDGDEIIKQREFLKATVNNFGRQSLEGVRG